MSGKTLDKITIIYLVIPMIIFIVGWLNPVVAFISCLALFFIVKQIFKSLLKRALDITKTQTIFLFIIAFLWCILAGIGRLYYQSPDWHIRNAIFRDLVNFSYPVIYDNGAALIYYFGLFLPGAIVGKLALFMHAAPETAFNVGNIFNLIYSSIGVFLVFLQTILLTNAKKKQIFLVVFLFILFSGLDILYGEHNNYNLMHIETHMDIFQFSCNTTLLFWVYNQTIAPWLITALFLRKSFNISNYGFWGTLGLFYAPLPFIGLSLYLLFMTIIRFVRHMIKKHVKIFFRDLFNLKNILSIFILLPIFYLFYSSNITASDDPTYILALPLKILIFVFIETGLYLFVIYKKNIKNSIFYITIFSLILVPFFLKGNNQDFCMRASIPALFVLFVLVMRYLFDNKRIIFGKVLISIALMLGMVTPCFEFYRGYYIKYLNPVEPSIKDEIKTLNNKIRRNCQKELLTTTDAKQSNYGNYKNYGAVDLDKQIFFKYLAKKPQK